MDTLLNQLIALYKGLWHVIQLAILNCFCFSNNDLVNLMTRLSTVNTYYE